MKSGWNVRPIYLQIASAIVNRLMREFLTSTLQFQSIVNVQRINILKNSVNKMSHWLWRYRKIRKWWTITMIWKFIELIAREQTSFTRATLPKRKILWVFWLLHWSGNFWSTTSIFQWQKFCFNKSFYCKI
jgi:hypothetical protein